VPKVTVKRRLVGMPMIRFGLPLMLGFVAGCHTLSLAPAVKPAPAQLPVTVRSRAEPDVSAVTVDPAASSPSRPARYRRLTAAECRVLAIKNAPLADELNTHPDNTPPAHSLGKKRPELAHESRLVRGYAADDIRNRAAGEALELFYKLAAAEGSFDHAASAHAILSKQRESAEKAVAVGAEDRAGVEKLRRQLLELESQLAKLEAGIAALNAGLAGRLGLDPADQTPLWPADPLRVSGEVPDAEQAVACAFKYRPDLNLLRMLVTDEDPGGELAKEVLRSVNPLLSVADAGSPLAAFVAILKKEPKAAEAKVQRQLQGVLAARERQADAEVRAAVAMVRGDLAAVAAKAAEVRNLSKKIAELEKREMAGQPVLAELTIARLDLLKLRGELVQAAADWHISDVKLRQALGLLIRE